MTIQEVRALHPMPWDYATMGFGNMRIFDAAGQEVPIMVLLDFTKLITAAIAGSMQTPPPAAAA